MKECAQRIANEVQSKHLKANPFGKLDPSRRWDHCLVSCRISRECKGGIITAIIAGDWFQDPWWQDPRTTLSDPWDRIANKVGRKLSSSSDSCCEQACTKEFNDGGIPNRPKKYLLFLLDN
ncbi:MAG: hypothetical protein AAGA80_28015 [Cyanobacteria bacterium P01_F01_bin.143]